MTISRTNSEIRKALWKLSNEVLGSLPLMELQTRRDMGNTNYNILIQRAEEANALLLAEGCMADSRTRARPLHRKQGEAVSDRATIERELTSAQIDLANALCRYRELSEELETAEQWVNAAIGGNR